MSDISIPSIRLGEVFPPDDENLEVEEDTEIPLEHLKPRPLISEPHDGIIRDPDEPVGDPFEALEPIDD